MKIIFAFSIELERRRPDPAPDEPKPSGDTYASAERAGRHWSPSIGFEPNIPEYAK